MNEREILILDAASQVFLRYGVKRTSMNDIAQEAGVARQTLYNAFSNKDAVLKGTIRLFTDRTIAEIKTALEKERDIGKRLDIVFQAIAVKPFKILRSSPNSEDIVEGMNAASRNEIEESNERFREIIETILEPIDKGLSRAGLTAHQLSDLIQKSASAAKTKAKDEEHLTELLKTLRILVLGFNV